MNKLVIGGGILGGLLAAAAVGYHQITKRPPARPGPALVIGDLVKFVGLAPSKDSLVGALREAGME